MDKKIIEKIQEAIEADSDMQDDFVAYDDMDAVKFDFGDILEQWMIPSVATDGSEALKVLANIFDTHNPKISILPFGEADKERAERAERWAEFHVSKINNRAGRSPFRKMAHMAGKYNRIQAQVDFLPYWLPKDKKAWTNEQKEQMRAGPFAVKLHNPRNVYFSMSDYGLRWVASVTNLSATEVIECWSIYDDKSEKGRKIQSAIRAIEKQYEENENVRYIHVDFTSYDKRQVAVFPTEREDIEGFSEMDPESDRTDIIDSENVLKFMNWVVVEGDSTPLLAGLHKGGLFNKKTLLNTIKDSSIIRRAFPPLQVSQTLDGEGVNVDYSGAEPEIKLKPGESIQPFYPPPLDNAVFQLAAGVSADVDAATGVKKLAGMDAGGNLQYSTVNAIIDLHMTNLEPYKRLAEKAASQIVAIMFKWVKYTGDVVESYRTKKDNTNQIIGEQIFMSPDDFDEDRLLIEVEFTAKTDKMQAINMITMLKNNGFRVPDSELLERVGFSNPEVLASQWEDEQLEGAALKNMLAREEQKIQLEAQAATMQMQQEQQMQMQQQQAQQQMQEQQQMQQEQSAVQGQGFDPSQGGTPPMMAEPGMTATQVPGERMQ